MLPRILVVLMFSAVLLPPSQSASAQSTVPSARPQTAVAGSNSDDLVAMKADLARMRVLVTQMQNNLGLATTSTTPLYHQFDLEIQMWQLLIDQMERRIEIMEHAKPSPKRE